MDTKGLSNAQFAELFKQRLAGTPIVVDEPIVFSETIPESDKPNPLGSDRGLRLVDKPGELIAINAMNLKRMMLREDMQPNAVGHSEGSLVPTQAHTYSVPSQFNLQFEMGYDVRDFLVEQNQKGLLRVKTHGDTIIDVWLDGVVRPRPYLRALVRRDQAGVLGFKVATMASTGYRSGGSMQYRSVFSVQPLGIIGVLKNYPLDEVIPMLLSNPKLLFEMEKGARSSIVDVTLTDGSAPIFSISPGHELYGRWSHVAKLAADNNYTIDINWYVLSGRQYKLTLW